MRSRAPYHLGLLGGLLAALVAPATASAQRASVPAIAPDTLPGDLYDGNNIRHGSACLTGSMLRDVVVIAFVDGTRPSDKRIAVNLVEGEVIGGRRSGFMDGWYYIRVRDSEDGGELCRATQKLRALPYVLLAGPELLLDVPYPSPGAP